MVIALQNWKGSENLSSPNLVTLKQLDDVTRRALYLCGSLSQAPEPHSPIAPV